MDNAVPWGSGSEPHREGEVSPWVPAGIFLCLLTAAADGVVWPATALSYLSLSCSGRHTFLLPKATEEFCPRNGKSMNTKNTGKPSLLRVFTPAPSPEQRLADGRCPVSIGN